jgi:hypothetical protein
MFPPLTKRERRQILRGVSILSPASGIDWLRLAPLLHNGARRPLGTLQEGIAVQSPWINLRGPARMLAISATVLLVSSGLLSIEAGAMIILGDARSLVVKPFILLGYLEFCGIFFSCIFIVAGIVGLIFYRPYLFVAEKIFQYRARRAEEISDKYTYFEDVPSPRHIHNPDEDGAPD